MKRCHKHHSSLYALFALVGFTVIVAGGVYAVLKFLKRNKDDFDDEWDFDFGDDEDEDLYFEDEEDFEE